VSDVARDHVGGSRAVAAAEQHGVDQQRRELVQRDALLVAGREWVGLGVGVKAARRRAAEQAQHRQVDLARAAVCSRVDQQRRAVAVGLHGDLWSGNVLADRDGAPLLIDPAAHGGPREVDLAMLRLFGGPSARCFDAYAEAYPLADGHDDRVALHQLTPLLVHAVLFGGSYGVRAADVIARYG
jgi:fructosamine-3-kinase